MLQLPVALGTNKHYASMESNFLREIFIRRCLEPWPESLVAMEIAVESDTGISDGDCFQFKNFSSVEIGVAVEETSLGRSKCWNLSFWSPMLP